MATLPATISNLISTLQQAQKITPPATGGEFSYLKMSKAGEWVYGAEETEVAANSVFVIDPASYAQGFVAWDGEGGLIDERMAVAGQPPILMSDLPALPNGARWDTQVAFALKGVEGDEEGIQLLYKTSSKGGRQVISELLGKIIERGTKGETALCPVVLLDTSSYKHKKFGKIYTPVLTVDEWMDIPDAEEAVAVTEVVQEVVPEVEEIATTTRTRRRRTA